LEDLHNVEESCMQTYGAHRQVHVVEGMSPERYPAIDDLAGIKRRIDL
jgi:hypothetical protein